MSKLYFNHWPFEKNEEVALYWFCSPFKNRYNNWTMRTIFKRASGKLEETYYPWGILPSLNIGGIYKDNLYTGKTSLPDSVNITIPLGTPYKIDDCFNIPSSIYNFFGNSEYGKQKCCIFTLDDTTFYLPCLEIIRSILCPNKFFLYRILEPYSFKNIVTKEELFSMGIKVFFTSEYPTSLLSKADLLHYVWINHSKNAKHTWNTVFQNRFIYASKSNNLSDNLRKSIPLEAGLPFDSKTSLYIKGIKHGNHFAAFEIQGISDLKMPFFVIHYNHPKVYDVIAESGEQSHERKNIQSCSSDASLDNSGESSEKSPDKIINETARVKISYSISPVVKRIKNKCRTVKKSGKSSYIEVNKENKDEKIIGTTQDWSRDGKIRPLEFKNL